MADSKISALPSATTPLAGTEVLPIVQGGTTKNVSIANLTAGRAITASSINTSVIKEANGNVGIGVTPSSGATGNLDLAGGAIIEYQGASGYFVTNAYYNSGWKYKLSSYASQLQVANGEHNFFYASSGTADAAITWVPSWTFGRDGYLTQKTAGYGINFTANTPAAGMTSQLLNWYEEGTWTPADNSAAALVFTGVVAQYTRIGSLVTCSFALTYPSTASGVSVSIKGLPFTSTSSDAGWGGVVTYTNYTTNGLTLLMDVGAKTFSVWSKGSTLLINSDLSSKTIRGVIQYRV